MNDIQSQINLVTAQINQYRDSELFSEPEKERLIEKAQKKLEEMLELQKQLNTNQDANAQ